MDYKKLADLLFPKVEKTPEYWEQKYPVRDLQKGAEVTRYAPSPTGFVHFGALFTSLVNNLVAKHSKGICFLRIEDTDKKREVEDSVSGIINALASFDIHFDEGVSFGGKYGPYTQSERAEIYQTYAKELVRQGKAYPCFCSEDELESMHTEQEKNKLNYGYYGEFAKCRNLSYEQIENKIKNGQTFVLRLKCPYTAEDKVDTFDLIRGERNIPQNANDAVILKSNGVPPYNFAHAVDDHLMRTTLVIRGDEWLPSLAEHLQLFEALGFKPPKYAHISPIQKLDENGNRRKLSKRKDPEANMNYFAEKGYPVVAVKDYIMTLINSEFENWRLQNPKGDIMNFSFELKKMNVSGALFDIVKLTDISKNHISHLTANEVYNLATVWAEKYDKTLFESLKQNKKYWLGILNIDREIPKPRKDLSCWSEIEATYSYMFDKSFYGDGSSEYLKKELKNSNNESLYKFCEEKYKNYIMSILQKYPAMYDEKDDQQQWFERIKDLAQEIGFAREVKEFKQNPEQYAGHCGDVSTIIRVALTGRTQTPNLYDICKLLGKDKIQSRFEKIIKNM